MMNDGASMLGIPGGPRPTARGNHESAATAKKRAASPKTITS
jgi:hypothetical protein